MIREQAGAPWGESSRWWAVGGDVGSVASIAQRFPGRGEVGWGGSGRLDSPGISQQRKASIKKVTRIRPPPPDPCVATRDSCKQPAPPCCDPCASCMCRFFRSTCSCRVLNPHC